VDQDHPDEPKVPAQREASDGISSYARGNDVHTLWGGCLRTISRGAAGPHSDEYRWRPDD
jgi:hypothetical protein